MVAAMRSASLALASSVLLLVPRASGSLSPITALPGADFGEVSGAHFGGYIQAEHEGRTLEAFTYFVQHQDPSAPLIIWMNGGPGASSLTGLFAELGPFLLNGQSVPKPPRRPHWRVFANPSGWHTVGSLLAWEQPAGVGFSRCVAGPHCDVWDDTTSAEANLAVLLAFLKGWPAEGKRDVYITGESYAGIYVPLLARNILRHNAGHAPGAHGSIALKGIAVGNGCVGFGVPGACGSDTLAVQLAYLERAVPGVDAPALEAARRACGGELHAGAGSVKDLSRRCRAALKKVWTELGQYNVYHVASPCGADEQGNWGDGEAFACGSFAACKQYFTSVAVQQALGVVPDDAQEAKEWQQWDGTMPGYNVSLPDVRGVYKELIAHNLEVLIYNGLRDSGVPTTGAERWVSEVGGPVKIARRGWAAGGQHVGHVVQYHKGLTYATIDGAGHLVPADRPQAALALIESLVRRTPLPAVPAGPDGACTSIWMGRGWTNLCEDSESSEGSEFLGVVDV